MLGKVSEDESLVASSFIEQSKKTNNTSQEYQLYQDILTFLNEHKELNHLINILNKVEN